MNYYGTSRTNYFHVTDEAKFAELMAGLDGGEGEIEDFTEKDKDGRLLHGFGCHNGNVEFYPRDKDGELDFENPSFDTFLNEIQAILPPDECFVFMESGAEGLRYVAGVTTIVTPTEIKTFDIRTMTMNYVAQHFKEKGIEPQPLRLEY